MAFNTLGAEAAKMWVPVAVDAFRTTPSKFLIPVGSMARFAIEEIMRSTEPEWSEIMVLAQVHRPIGDGVTPVTLAAATTLMHIDVAVRTLLRGIRVDVHNVAFRAIHLSMTAFQGITGLRAVVELMQRRPLSGRVALVTWLGKLPLMKVLVAIPTCGIDRFVMPLRMTARTGHLLVLSFKFKSTHVMVEEGNFPTLESCMTLVTRIFFELHSVTRRVAEAAVCIGIIITLST